MKREEERIGKLFQQQREEDERNAPSFTHDWNGALSRREKPRRSWAVWLLATGVAALILLGAGCLGWWMFFRHPTKRQVPIESVRSNISAPDTTPPVSSLPGPVRNPRNVARLRPFVRPQPPAVLISQWRSPTESLLRTPGEQLFKRTPRLDESLVNIKATIPGQQN
jgi:hypothetical protein